MEEFFKYSGSLNEHILSPTVLPDILVIFLHRAVLSEFHEIVGLHKC